MNTLQLTALVLSAFAAPLATASSCNDFTDCASCTTSASLLAPTPALTLEPLTLEPLLGCNWCPSDSVCHKFGSLFNPCSSDTYLKYANTCPLTPAITQIPSFLPDWMSTLTPIIENLTLLDLTLPGTHDSLTYDLSLTISDGGIDDHDDISKILHMFSDSVVPSVIEDFIRQQATTQKLTITQQLDNGVRFVDFRQMQESDKSWHSLHCVQSKDIALNYYKEIRQWLDAHPDEIVALWISKHGNGGATGSDAYPEVTKSEKRKFWGEIVEVFEGVIVDTSVSQMNVTTIAELRERNHRLIPYVGDYDEFTGGPNQKFALDGTLVDNNLGSSVDNEMDAYNSEIAMFKSMKDLRANDKSNNKLYLRSMATSSGDTQVEAVAMMKFDPFANKEEQTKKCTDSFNMPDGMLYDKNGDGWCPPTLMDIAQLGQYYKQVSLDEAYNNFDNGWYFPNAIYLDALDYDGTVRTGTTLEWGEERDGDDGDETHRLARYAYADTLIGFNVKLACVGKETDEACVGILKLVEDRRANYPLNRWDDAKYGRSATWPV